MKKTLQDTAKKVKKNPAKKMTVRVSFRAMTAAEKAESYRLLAASIPATTKKEGK